MVKEIFTFGSIVCFGLGIIFDNTSLAILGSVSVYIAINI